MLVGSRSTFVFWSTQLMMIWWKMCVHFISAGRDRELRRWESGQKMKYLKINVGELYPTCSITFLVNLWTLQQKSWTSKVINHGNVENMSSKSWYSPLMHSKRKHGKSFLCVFTFWIRRWTERNARWLIPQEWASQRKRKERQKRFPRTNNWYHFQPLS